MMMMIIIIIIILHLTANGLSPGGSGDYGLSPRWSPWFTSHDVVVTNYSLQKSSLIKHPLHNPQIKQDYKHNTASTQKDDINSQLDCPACETYRGGFCI